LFGALQVAGGEDGLMGRRPPVGTGGGASNEFIAVVEENKGVGVVAGCGEYYAHFDGVWQCSR
jgi:hypothetical protein